MDSTIKKIWWWSLFVKLAIACWLPLSNDEAYYWVWSHHLQLSYFDHPPMISWLFFLGHWLEPLGHAVRWPSVLAGHIGFAAWLFLLKPYFTKNNLIWFCAFYLFNPLTGPGGLIATPDLPLMMMWPISLLFLKKALNVSTAKNFFFLGIALGLGFCAKYHIVLFLPPALIWAYHRKKLTRVLSPKAILFVSVGFLLGGSPVFAWNYLNDFQSFLFQIGHGLGHSKWEAQFTSNYILGQIALLLPPVIYLALQKKSSDFSFPLKVFFLFPLFFFFLTSFKGDVEANWPILAYPPFLALASLQLKHLKIAVVSIAVWGVALLLTLSDVAFRWIPSDEIKTAELYQYQNIIEAAPKDSPLFARTYQMASKLSYELKKPVYKLYRMNRRDFFDFRPESIPKTSSYSIVLKKNESLPKWAIRRNHTILSRKAADQEFDIAKVKILK
jgi:4-amino-4-deoxy-L-arabinose transferase-like glycosyltransferase